MEMNIRAYKVVFTNGRVDFEFKSRDGRDVSSCATIKSLAAYMRDCVNDFLKDNLCSQVSIDLFPFHEIECSSGFLPKKCLPLSPEEKQRFWEYYKYYNNNP